LEVVNEGNAMDLTTGKFTAPQPGIYFFTFTGHASFPGASAKVHLAIELYLNGNYIGLAYVDEANTVANQVSPLTVQSTVNLKSGDQIWVAIREMTSGVILIDNSNHWTHFTGFMLEEDVVASL
jgi:hypothetical protein